MRMNKNLLTNLIALLITTSGFFSPIYGNELKIIGFFSLSGSLTNWLAIHMLFEKIVFFYGSGVIANNFEEIKLGIKKLILDEFFSIKNIESYFKNNFQSPTEDYFSEEKKEKIFLKFMEAIEESSLSNMLNFIGGKEALIPLKEPIIKKINEFFRENLNNDEKEVSQNFLILRSKIEKILDERLLELNSNDVKKIVQNMIRKHLGWLVIWGGVVGGFIGLVCSFVNFDFF